MVTQIFNIQRTSDGKTYQNDGTWGNGNNKSFSSELEATTLIDTQDNGNYRLNPLYVKS